MNEKIKTGVETIDQIVDLVALPWMKMSKNSIKNEFCEVFSTTSGTLIFHYISKWNKDFAAYYLNMDSGMIRQMFNYYSIPLEEEKYPAEIDRVKMQLLGKPRIDIFPFEQHIVFQFYLMAYNNSLQLLYKIAPGAYEATQKKKINPFGNGLNWSKAWQVLDTEQKEAIVKFLFTYK